MKKTVKYAGEPGSMHPESDPMPGSVEEFYDHTWGEILLWTGTLGGPSLWAVQMQTNYSLVEWSCITGNVHLLRIIGIVFLAMALATGALSLWNWRKIGTHWPRTGDEGIRARTRLLAMLGVFLSLLFAVLIGAQVIAQFFFDPCTV